MGIPGLTSYINSLGTLWTEINLQNTELVIDGPCLCHYLYDSNGLDCRCGGQYQEYYDVVVSFFDALISYGVEPYVVFDGAYDDKKLETREKRAKDKVKTSNALSQSADDRLFLLPPLAKDVFVDALRNRGVKFAFSDREADREIASLANAWNCPVLSNDSDFFIFDIKAGYIPITFFNWNSSCLTVRIFYRRKLAMHFQIRAELIPLFASLAGNDYVSCNLLSAFHRALNPIQTSNHSREKGAKFESLANMLSKPPDSSEEEALERALKLVKPAENGEHLRQAVELSLQEYTLRKSNLLGYFQDNSVSSSLKTQSKGEINDWVLRQFRNGKFSVNCIRCLTSRKVFLEIPVENCTEKSANCCSLWLRQFMYGILNDAETKADEGNIEVIHEWDREGLSVKKSAVEPYQESVVPSLSCIPSLVLGEPVHFLLFALYSDITDVRSLREEFILIAASLRYLINNAQPPLKVNHLKALLCCCVNLEEGKFCNREERTARPEQSSWPFDIRAAQSFAQWQCVLRDAIHLNFTLLEPVPVPSIHKTFNGKMAQQLLERLQQGQLPQQFLRHFGLFRLFHRLYLAVTSGLLEKMASE
ncbi:protein asteroid homolog 1-like [Stylophora pistillata]|uniref:protein asteroid homolog 1-like n=1 Tax=Stylophora pistillata TaxID=50429 RepID=UPI000C0522C4|nr:protein asteroid homolog 1-like [Stylophora pistillata]